MDVRALKDILHKNISQSQGHQLLKGVIDEMMRRQANLRNNFSLFGSYEGVSEVLIAKVAFYRPLNKALKKEKLWLARMSSTIPDVLVIDYVRFVAFTGEWDYGGHRVALTKSGWKDIDDRVRENDLPERIQGEELANSDIRTLMDFLDRNRINYNMMFDEFIASLKHYSPSVYAEASLYMTMK